MTYSHLAVGQLVTLSGGIQLVLQPELFGFVPTFGETFDVIESPAGISIPNGLTLTSFVTHGGASYVPGFPLTPYNSGIEGDPDQLDQFGQAVFTYTLVNNVTVLRATYVGQVPEPSTGAMLVFSITTLLAARRRRSA